MNRSKKALAGIAAVAIVGISGFAFAHGGFGGGDYRTGMRSGGHMMGSGGYNGHMGADGYGHHMGYGDYGQGQQLSDEQFDQINKARGSFFNASNEIRINIEQKRLAFESELAKQSPDLNKLRKIQRDLSGLKAEFDQQRLEHELEIRKMVPNAGSDY